MSRYDILASSITGLRSVLCVLWGLAICAPAAALPPAPPNDDPVNAEVIGPTLPIIVYGTTVLANDSISTTTLPAPADDVDGPDVFYSLAPAVSDTYRVQLLPWQRAPLRSSDRRFTIYVQDGADVFLAGARASGSARGVHFDVALTAGMTYRIGVDYNAATHDNFPFTLVVDRLPLTFPDDCASVVALASSVPTAVLHDIDGATADFAFVQGTGRCAVSGTTPTTAPGNDHVYSFTPSITADYAFELHSGGFDGVLYINTSCPPLFPGGCLGASNHSTSGGSGGKHELAVASLDAGTTYYVYVDNGSTSLLTGNYTLIVDTAFAYEINEIEPNDTFSMGTAVATPLNGGQLVGPLDEDWWALSGQVGDRVYAWANNGGSSNSTLDTDLAFYAADGTSLIEFDDEDGDGADAPIEDLRYVYSTTSPVIAGARLTSTGTHYLKVTDQSATGTVHRYRLHIGVEPDSRAPLSECEPNDTLASADLTGKHYYAGVIDVVGDVDFYAFEAAIGDRVFVAADGDPERDGTGVDSPNTDPRAFHAKLVVYDPAGDVLISDISDSNAIQSAPDYPGQGGFFVARSTGTHYVAVSAQSAASQVGSEETYELAIFLNDAAPALSEDSDPVLTLTPDYPSDTIAVDAQDNASGDSGICDAELVDSTNLQITGLAFTPGDAVVSFTVALVNGAQSGFGKLRVTDCAGNTACAIALIDVNSPVCDGFNFSNRSPASRTAPIHIKDNEPAGPGIDGTIEILESGAVTDVNITLTIETIRPPDIDAFLVSPTGTIVELITDRGSSLAFDITDATFDDDAEEIMPLLSGDAPYTGTWLPEDPGGLAQLNGEDAQGIWRLNVRDDSNSANGGARLVRWSLDLDATFAGPETFAGSVSDTQGFDSGIASVELSGETNVELNLPPGFTPGDPTVDYTVTLIDSTLAGSGTVTVTDLAENTCQSIVNLSGLPDVTDPANSGTASTSWHYGQEVQVDVPGGVPAGVTSTIDVPESMLVGEVEVDITVDTKDIGRLAATLTHDNRMASLVNRVGMDDRGSVGLTKDIIDITLDDDAPVADDAHEEPASGAIEFFGLHQPDGRGKPVGDAITSDERDAMLFRLADSDSAGIWDLFVGDFRIQGAGSAHSVFRRWSMLVKSPCGAEHYFATATDLAPGSGICSLDLLPGATNLAVTADFVPGDEIVDYGVALIDPSQAGGGMLVIEDCAGNTVSFPVNLSEARLDQLPPLITGAVNPASMEFEGTATDDRPDDSGIIALELAPHADNLQIVSMVPSVPPGVAPSVDFVIGLVDPGANGRGYVRVTDGCDWRAHVLVHIDAVAPICTGAVGNRKRYLSGGDLPADIPDNNVVGVVSTITVSDTDIISDADITINITHPFDDDIDLRLTSPTFRELFTDIGSTGNDFIDTTLDDDAPSPIPDSSSEAPFTGSYQPEGGPSLFVLDGNPANGLYTLQVLDDAVFNLGTFESWSLTLESPTFPLAFHGRAQDGEAHATGICSIELLPGADNLTLTTDPFTPGDAIVRYRVDLGCTVPGGVGTGTVRVTDCGGGTCDVPIDLDTAACCFVDGSCADVDPGCCAGLGGVALVPGTVCLGDGDEDGTDDACEQCPLAAQPAPEAKLQPSCGGDPECFGESVCIDGGCYVPKNKYISLSPGNAGESVAIRVTLSASADFPGAVDSSWWVQPHEAADPPDVFRLGCDTHYQDWSTEPAVIHVGDVAITSGASYAVEAIHIDCPTDDPGNYSPALLLPTVSVWGDCTGPDGPPDGDPGFSDILQVVKGFQNSPDAANDVWLDVDPDRPDGEPTFADILAVVLGFQGNGYPYDGPIPCP